MCKAGIDYRAKSCIDITLIPLVGKLTCHTAKFVGESKGILIEGNRYYLMHF